MIDALLNLIIKFEDNLINTNMISIFKLHEFDLVHLTFSVF